MKNIVLSKRLKAAADMVCPGSRVCDVGCDHGWVSIYLIEQGISKQVIATDVNCEPLGRARKHIRDRNLTDYIETRLSDGFKEIRPGEADTVIIAGMGGRLMQAILAAEPAKTAAFQELILQPQSEIPAFRRFLRQAGHTVRAEDMVVEDNKYYPLMKVIPAAPVAVKPRQFQQQTELRPEQRQTDPQSEQRQTKLQSGQWQTDLQSGQRQTATQSGQLQLTPEDRWGRLLLERRHPVLHQYLIRIVEHHKQIINQITNENTNNHHPESRKQNRVKELLEEVGEINRILQNW